MARTAVLADGEAGALREDEGEGHDGYARWSDEDAMDADGHDRVLSVERIACAALGPQMRLEGANNESGGGGLG